VEIGRLEAQEAAELPALREKADRALAAFRKAEEAHDRALAAYRESRYAADSKASTLDAHKSGQRRILRDHVPAALAELLEWLNAESEVIRRKAPDTIRRTRYRAGLPFIEGFSNFPSIQARAMALCQASVDARALIEEPLLEQEIAARCSAIRKRIPAVEEVKDPDA